MQVTDQERAVLQRAQQILKRLQPVVDNIVATELVARTPEGETRQLKTSLEHSLTQMEDNLGRLGFPADKKYPFEPIK
jgi:hypothetical protein